MIDGHWLPAKDGDPRVYALMRRHYSSHIYADGRRRNLNYRNRFLVCGPGEKMVLLTVDCSALFIWRKFIDDSGQQGVNCAVFRNEGEVLSSELILEAEQLAWLKWPGERLYTYVDPKKVKTALWYFRKPNPGKCFIMVGWRRLEQMTKSGKVILEKLSEK